MFFLVVNWQFMDLLLNNKHADGLVEGFFAFQSYMPWVLLFEAKDEVLDHKRKQTGVGVI